MALCRSAMSSRRRTLLSMLTSKAIAAAVLCPLAAAFLVPDLCVGSRFCTPMKRMRRPPIFALRPPRLPAPSSRRQAIGITGWESCHGQDDPHSDGQIDDKVIRANRLPNLSRAQDLNELLAMVRPFTATGHGAPALEGWEAALVMNRVSRLMKRPRLSVTTGRSAAFSLLSRLVGVVITRGEVLKPKGFAWALNACDSLPRRATSAAPSAKGYVANIGTRTNSSISYATRDEALVALVPVMLAQLSRFGDTDEGVVPQNLAIFTSALAQLATAGVGLPEESRAQMQLLSTLALDQVFRQSVWFSAAPLLYVHSMLWVAALPARKLLKAPRDPRWTVFRARRHGQQMAMRWLHLPTQFRACLSCEPPQTRRCTACCKSQRRQLLRKGD